MMSSTVGLKMRVVGAGVRFTLRGERYGAARVSCRHRPAMSSCRNTNIVVS